jgi:hypothetical protein
VFFGIGMQVCFLETRVLNFFSKRSADSAQGVPWLYPTEINSLAMRTKGAAIGTATNWIFNFMGALSKQKSSVCSEAKC